MAYSYDRTLNVQFPSNASIPTSMAAEGGDRKLEGSVVLGFVGTATTAGSFAIKIGDGVTVDRYGIFETDTLVLGRAVTGKLTLTEEGYHMGVANSLPDVPAVVLTVDATGGGGSTNLQVIVGYY